jgi:hypothetical protein
MNSKAIDIFADKRYPRIGEIADFVKDAGSYRELILVHKVKERCIHVLERSNLAFEIIGEMNNKQSLDSIKVVYTRRFDR